MNYDNYCLFSRPSFLEGMARVLDIGATFDSYNTSRTEQEADARAICSDWCMVGQDLIGAAKSGKKEQKNT